MLAHYGYRYGNSMAEHLDAAQFVRWVSPLELAAPEWGLRSIFHATTANGAGRFDKLVLLRPSGYRFAICGDAPQIEETSHALLT